jgi:hypothetical protein
MNPIAGAPENLSAILALLAKPISRLGSAPVGIGAVAPLEPARM